MNDDGGGDDDTPRGDGIGGRNQRRRTGRAYDDQNELGWMSQNLPFRWDNLKLNCPENSMIPSKTSFEPPPPDSDDSDDSDDDEHMEVNLASLQQVVTYGTNYTEQRYTAVCAIILGIQLVNNVQVTSYQRGGNQRGGNRQNLTNQRMLTLLCPQSGAGSNTFVIIDARQSTQLFRNDPTNRDAGTVGEKSIN